MNNFSPILITTLNRHDHFKRCIDSLSRCVHSEETELYIALDYPFRDSHWEGYNRIKDFIDHITGFKAVHIIKRETNYGALKNYIEGKKAVLQEHNTIIFAEEDNEFSANFLDYINNGLIKFKDDPNVIAICGSNYPIQMPKDYPYNYYFYQTFLAWGYGMWKNKLETLYYSLEELSAFMKNFNLARNIYLIAEQKPLSILEKIKGGLPTYGDGVISLENVKNGTYCIFPTVTKVRNYGHDGTGLNCGKIENDIFSVQILDVNQYFHFDENIPVNDQRIAILLKKYFKLSFKAKIKLLLLYILCKMNLLNQDKKL